jgi:AcrR family transcriptional regulator
MNVKPNATASKHDARSEATRAALLAAARPLFAAQGYGSVGTEAIVRAAGVTRGALYHQFRDKADLFEAVFEAVELEITEVIAKTVLDSGAASAVEGLIAGAEAWLDACGDPAVQRIILIDAPSILGWERWREIGVRYGLGLTEAALQGAMDAGEIPAQPLRPLAHVLIGALDEAALYIARAEDPVTARAEVGAVLTRLVQSLSLPA